MASVTARPAPADRPVDGHARPALSARGITARHGSTPVLADLDLTVAEGEVLALCGPNGSGKSTLLRVLAGLHPASRGEVHINGDALGGLSRRDLARRLAFLPQQPVMPEGLTVREVVALARHPHRRALGRLTPADRRAVTAALDRAEVAAFAERPLEALSGGERQRVWLALTLAQEAATLLLDEPTTYLDPHHQIGMLRRIRRLARELGLTVVWVLHDLNQAAAYSDRLVLLKDGGCAAAGAPDAVLTEAIVRRVFDLDTMILPHPETGRPLCVPRA